LAKINFDGVEYEVESLSQETRSEFEMLVASEQRMRELQRDLAIIQTARNAYANGLKERLRSETPIGSSLPEDTLTVNN